MLHKQKKKNKSEKDYIKSTWKTAKARSEIATFWLQIRQLNPYAMDKYPNNRTDVNDMTEKSTRIGKDSIVQSACTYNLYTKVTQ